MQLKSRIFALPLAAVLASGALFTAAPAQAAPKSKLYKGGAIALGALGAYMLSKGKTVEGAALLGGGYLAYKQGGKESRNEKYNDRWNNDNWNNRNNRRDNGRNNWNGNWNGGNDYRYNNSSYNNGYGGNGYYQNGSGQDCRDGNNNWGRGNGRSWNR